MNPWWFAFTLLLVAADRVMMAVRWLLLLRAADVDIHGRAPCGSSWSARSSAASCRLASAPMPRGPTRSHRGRRAAARRWRRSASIACSAWWPSRCWALAGLAGWAQHVEPALRLRLMAVAAARRRCVLAVFWVDQWLGPCCPRAGTTPAGAGAPAPRGRGRRYRGRPTVLAQVMALSIAVQLVRIFQGYGLGRGLGIPVGLATTWCSCRSRC